VQYIYYTSLFIFVIVSLFFKHFIQELQNNQYNI